MKFLYSFLTIILLIFPALLPAQNTDSDNKAIQSFALLVRDYDETIQFYTEKLGFELVSDQKYGENMRWVSLKLPGSEIQVTLGKAGESDKQYVGKQAGSNYPLFVMVVDDVEKMYETYQARGVHFTQEPTQRPWGLGAVLEDLYGNKIYLQSR